MKRLFTFIFLSLISISVFAETFELFPWNASKKEIYNTCKKFGWSIDNSADGLSFTVTPNAQTKYYNNNIDSIFFYFADNDLVVNQTIILADFLTTSQALTKVLDLAVKDKAKMQNYNIDYDNLYIFTYSALLDNGIEAKYIFYGQDTLLKVSVSYTDN